MIPATQRIHSKSWTRTIKPLVRIARSYTSSSSSSTVVTAAATSLLNTPPLAPAALSAFLGAAQSRLAINSPSSIVVLASPGLAPSLVAFAESYTGAPSLVVAAVDGIPLGAQRNALSALFLNSPLALEDALPLQSNEQQQLEVLGRPSARGVRTARNPWTLDHGVLAVRVGDQDAPDFAVQLASTLFETGTQTTLMYVPGTTLDKSQQNQNQNQNQNQHPLARKLLASAHIHVASLGSRVTAHSCAPLRDLSEGQTHAVTAAKSNMVKQIDGKSAAGFLERSVALMEPHKDANADVSVPVHVPERKVFAQVGVDGSRYEVIAGGGGAWSARSRMLVLDPGASPIAGDSISFWLSEPGLLFDETRYARYLEQNGVELKGNNGLRIALECAPVVEDLEILNGRSGLLNVPEATVVDNLFGASCENGFLVGSAKHSVPGELFELRVSN
ncbi:uncharacterized protein SAPINGB_P006379 [Magnusiomyces paraingens]|uniref:FIST domain-containing protein n=1 Tax=Magnusiomyces paraingens TaxID=2606893 RepID=A0A5E8C9S8_9ASCO|nr:uncharacterized protein SAPINGB_P006379 [Saprochaete ingens]VVT58778.1 unnamed protein product [Saprochaete ingens]